MKTNKSAETAVVHLNVLVSREGRGRDQSTQATNRIVEKNGQIVSNSIKTADKLF